MNVVVVSSDGPIIECDRTMADVHQFNVYLRCLVRARPSVTSLFWIAEVNGTSTSVSNDDHDDVASDYWSTVTVLHHDSCIHAVSVVLPASPPSISRCALLPLYRPTLYIPVSYTHLTLPTNREV